MSLIGGGVKKRPNFNLGIQRAHDRGVPNPNNLAKSEFIRKQIDPFLTNRMEIIEIMNILIWLLINRIGVCSILAIPLINRIQKSK